MGRYGSAHQRLRTQLKPQVEAGGIECAYGDECTQGGIIEPGQPWDLAHVPGSDTEYLGPAHAKCNRATVREQRQLAGARSTAYEWF